MKIKNHSIYSLASVLIVALMLSACSDPKTDIIGSWQQINSDNTITFRKDGQLTINASGVNIGGSYEFVDETHIKFEYQGIVKGIMDLAEAISGPGASVFEIRLSGNSLTLIDIAGKKKEYRRVK